MIPPSSRAGRLWRALYSTLEKTRSMLTLNMGITNRSQDIKGPMCKQKSPHGLLSKDHTVKQTVTKHSVRKMWKDIQTAHAPDSLLSHSGYKYKWSPTPPSGHWPSAGQNPRERGSRAISLCPNSANGPSPLHSLRQTGKALAKDRTPLFLNSQ